MTKRWVWAGGNQPAEERDAAGNVTRRFYPQGEQAGAVKYFYTKDHLGSIREVLGANGTVVSSSRYDAWGVRTTHGVQDAASFGFTGHLEHKELGLVFTLYRAYDPATGRWLSRDPMGEDGGINLYGYVRNGPMNWVDPKGLDRTIHFAGHMWLEVDVYDACGNKTGTTTLSFAPERLFNDADTDWGVDVDQQYPFSLNWKIKSDADADNALVDAWKGQASLGKDGIGWNGIANCWNITLGASTWGIK